jgi:hypothetical protein
MFDKTVFNRSHVVRGRGVGEIAFLGPGLVTLVVAGESKANQATGCLEIAHTTENFGGSNHVLPKVGKSNSIDCVEVVANTIPVRVEEGRQLPT